MIFFVFVFDHAMDLTQKVATLEVRVCVLYTELVLDKRSSFRQKVLFDRFFASSIRA